MSRMNTSCLCKCCNFETGSRELFKEHLESNEHLKNEIFMLKQLGESINCIICNNFKTNSKKAYKEHLESKEHMKNKNFDASQYMRQLPHTII